jgi:hypothetical protein
MQASAAAERMTSQPTATAAADEVLEACHLERRVQQRQ